MKKALNSITVIIPTYNRSNTIEKCIQSILNQTADNTVEIIVVDDCSTDNTAEVVKSFSNINLLKTSKNSGAQSARNIGIEAAKSEWIAFNDSDDEWLPDKLEKQFLALEMTDYNPFTVVHGDCIVNNLDAGTKIKWNLDKTDGDNVYPLMLTKSGTFFPAILTSKQALEKIGYLDENVKSFHEWDTAIRLSKICRFIHIQEPLFIYNIQKNSMSNSHNNNLDGYLYIVKKYENEIRNVCGDTTFDEHLINSSNMAMDFSNYRTGRELISKIEKDSIKKKILLLLSYLHIKPKYLYQIMNYLSWKN